MSGDAPSGSAPLPTLDYQRQPPRKLQQPSPLLEVILPAVAVFAFITLFPAMAFSIVLMQLLPKYPWVIVVVIACGCVAFGLLLGMTIHGHICRQLEWKRHLRAVGRPSVAASPSDPTPG